MAAYLGAKARHGLLAGASAGAVYAGVLLMLMVISLGGPRKLKARYRH